MASAIAYVLMGLAAVGGAGTLLAALNTGSSFPCPKCKRQIMADWNSCLFCGAIPEFELGKPGLLHFVSGPLAQQIAVLERPITTIGSVAGNDIVLMDPGVSRKHIGIRKVEGGYEVADFGSTNGVFVNGERIPKKKLAIGDVLKVGGTEMIFRV
jgi:hypothetical protein